MHEPVAGIGTCTTTCPPPHAPCTAQLQPPIPENQNLPCSLASFACAVNIHVGDDLFVEFDTPSIDRKRQAQS